MIPSVYGANVLRATKTKNMFIIYENLNIQLIVIIHKIS